MSWSTPSVVTAAHRAGRGRPAHRPIREPSTTAGTSSLPRVPSTSTPRYRTHAAEPHDRSRPRKPDHPGDADGWSHERRPDRRSARGGDRRGWRRLLPHRSRVRVRPFVCASTRAVPGEGHRWSPRGTRSPVPPTRHGPCVGAASRWRSAGATAPIPSSRSWAPSRRHLMTTQSSGGPSVASAYSIALRRLTRTTRCRTESKPFSRGLRRARRPRQRRPVRSCWLA